MDNDEVGMSPVLAPTKKGDPPKEKDAPAEPTPAKAGAGKSTPATASKGKRKAPAAGEETKPSANKKAKAEGGEKVILTPYSESLTEMASKSVLLTSVMGIVLSGSESCTGEEGNC